MDFKTDLNLDAGSLASLLEQITESLRSSGGIQFPLGFTNISLPVGEANINARISVEQQEGTNNLTLILTWTEETVAVESNVVSVKAESAKIVEAETLFEESEPLPFEAQEADLVVEETVSIGRKSRMPLGTTTFSTDVGAYLSAFVEDAPSFWQLIIDRDAKPANTKWAKAETLDGIPQIPSHGKGKRSVKSHSTAPPKKSKAYVTEIEGVQASTQIPVPGVKSRGAAPAPRTKQRVEPSRAVPPSMQTPPSTPPSTPAPPPAARKPAPSPTARKVVATEETVTWSEPSRDNISTGDDWVKPSEILKKKQGGAAPPPPMKERPVPGIVVEEPPFKPSEVAKIAGTADSAPPPPKTADRGRPEPSTPKKGKEKKKAGWADWE